MARIERQVEAGKTSVEIRHLPYESYLWTATPEWEPWIERYKLFYGLPEDLEIKAVWEYSKKKITRLRRNVLWKGKKNFSCRVRI